MFLATEPSTEESIEQTLTVFEKWKNSMWDWLTDSNTWEMFLLNAIKIILIVVVTRILIRVIHGMINRTMAAKEHKRVNMNPRRLVTVGKLLKNIVSLSMNFIMILVVLSIFHINLAPLIAGAGVVGLAIGFGAQSLVKDVMTGFFIVFEDQFAVGDVIQVGQSLGTVEMIGLRSTRIHSWTGEVHIIPNGAINEVTNFSLNNSIAVVDMSVSYEEDVERVTSVIEQTLAKLPERCADVVSEPSVLGIQNMGASEIIIRVTAECKPYTQAGVGRKIKLELKKAFDEHHIEIPYPRLVTFQRDEGGKAGGV
ncbi:mechanosensitive ion channel family protein [Paenibacillus sp. 1001270B_150601_E10]|uniref:mechanosensitive ion channel family protein n=1 Tax=Paenibacillus sp. 1001270B_150601_E10 TaxID=2787079 RepID=UPI00189DA781|nr:mechanosensitive ion channel family protein [Paenibacillus sp. 1001270B_150601_E10]